MTYTFQWGEALKHLPYLLEGARLSLVLAILGFWGGAVIGLLGAVGKVHGGRLIYRFVDLYVVFFTNTPALVQIFFLFYALPEVGILLPPFAAVLIGLVVNTGAYLTEIQLAGFTSVRQTEIEAAEVLGMSLAQIVRYVIVPHIVKTLFAPLSSFYIWFVLGTSMAPIFGVEDLTGRAINISTTNSRTIGVFSVTAAIYVAITILASAVLALIGRHAFRVRAKIF